MLGAGAVYLVVATALAFATGSVPFSLLNLGGFILYGVFSISASATRPGDLVIFLTGAILLWLVSKILALIGRGHDAES